MNELVSLRKDQAVCSSLDVADHFSKRHSDVIRAIENLLSTQRNFALSDWLVKSSYKDASGKSNTVYYMTRDGFSLLVMGFTGKKALDWKVKYIEAFNKMEALLSETKTREWLESRKHGKLTRKAETDVIQQLIGYAQAQGSKNAEKLYMVYSKLVKVSSGIEDRDKAAIHEINNLDLMEYMILNCIKAGMAEGLHYKDIYQNCKARLLQFNQLTYKEARA